jgi:hypothetical protein
MRRGRWGCRHGLEMHYIRGWIETMKGWMLTDQDFMVGGVGIDVSVLAIGQDGLAALGNQSESVGKAGGADGAGEGGDGGERELHFVPELDL